MKKALVMLLVVALLAGVLEFTSVRAAEGVVVQITIGSTKATINSKAVVLDQPPIIENSLTLVPFRFIGEAIGATIGWDSDPVKKTVRTVSYVLGNKKIVLTIGSITAMVNGVKTTLDVAPKILPTGRTVVPLRFVSENIGAKVDWNSTTRMVTVTVAPRWSTPIKIVLSAPFTGSGSILGEYCKDGAQLAVDEINAAGGVNGAKFDLITYDDQANASTAATVVRRALDSDKAVAIFGPNMSSAVLGVHTLAQQAKVPMLVGATSPSLRYDTTHNDYLFRLRADDGVKVAQQVKYIVEILKAKKPGIILGSTDYCTSALAVAKQAFDKYGIKIVDIENMKEGDKDVTAQVTNLKNAGIDVLVGLTHEPEAAVVMLKVRQLKLTVPIVGFSAWGVPAFTDLAGDAAIGVISVQGFNPADTDPTVKKFVDAYKAKWGKEPSDPAQCYYDGVYLLKKAIETAGSTDPVKIDEALKTVEYTGVQGLMKCDALHNFTNICYISQFDGKTWKVISKIP